MRADHGANANSTPLNDGFAMPAEFAPHAGCWMLWPERPDNWRLGAQPAQLAFTEVAAAIARFEPVTMGVSPQQFEFARAQLPAHIRVVEMSHDDSWMRDVGPTFVTNKKGMKRGVDWRFNAWGGLRGGLVLPLGPGRPGRAEGSRDRGLRPIPRAHHQRGRRDPRRRAGHGAGDRGRCASIQTAIPISAGRDRATPDVLPGRADRHLAGQTGSSTTKPAAISTISRVS